MELVHVPPAGAPVKVVDELSHIVVAPVIDVGKGLTVIVVVAEHPVSV